MLHVVYSIAINILMTNKPQWLNIAERADALTAKASGHTLSCDCTMCCGIRTEARLALETEANKLVTVQAASPEPAGERIPAPPTELQWIRTVRS